MKKAIPEQPSRKNAYCIVKAVHQTERNIGLSLIDSDDAENQNDHAAARSRFPSLSAAIHCVIDVGNVTILSNCEIPALGDVVEVAYSYADEDGCLYQPVYLGKRPDIVRTACATSQLKRIG